MRSHGRDRLKPDRSRNLTIAPKPKDLLHTMRPLMLSRRRAVTVTLLVGLSALTVLLAACGSSSTPSAATTTPTTRPTDVAEIKYGTGTVLPPATKVSVPTERGSRPINCANDAGQEVIIAKGGNLCPAWLDAEVQLPITWTNLSGAPQTIIFNDAPVHTTVIAPGGTFTWHSPPYAIGLDYHTAVGHQAHLQLQSANAQ